MKPYWQDRFPRMTRLGRAGRLRGPGATVVVLLLALGLVGSMSPGLATADSAALSADAARLVAPAPSEASAPADLAGDGPSPHFGFSSVLAQSVTAPVPLANLTFSGTVIPIPAWTVANQSTDIPAWDPVRRVMYVPNRVFGTDGAETAID